MISQRDQLRKNPVIQTLSSIRITVTCLSLLLILTFWGTIDQVYNGLYHAQEQFFHSLMFLAFGFLPFPGAQLVLWVLFINLLCGAVVHFIYRPSHLGILIIHFGLFTYFIAAFVTFISTQESNVSLYEEEGSNLSTAYHDWELALWKENGNKRKVVAYDLPRSAKNLKFNFDEFGTKVNVKEYYPHSEAYVSAPGSGEIKTLRPLSLLKEPEKHIPGGIFEIAGKDVILYGAESTPKKISEDVFVQLRRRKFEMPFLLKLKDFRMETHPNTQIARSYESLVQIQNSHITRDVLISMNHPLRYKDFTLYQASYAIDAMGRQISTLAVVKNTGRILPYISSFIVFAGLIVHFLVMGFYRRRKKTAQ